MRRISAEEQKSQCYKDFKASPLSQGHTINSFVNAYFEFKKNYTPPKSVACAPPGVLTGDLSNCSWEDYTQYGFDEVEREMLGYD